MCGIAGFHRHDTPASVEQITALTDALRHRGPDDAGWMLTSPTGGVTADRGGRNAAVDPTLALGHRRLSILDLSEAGHQPMCDPSGRYWVVYNGEVYNYRELRAELRERGHEFHTGTDTEVLLAAFAEWGIDCLSRFNGMWAFALWDSQAAVLWCARDRFGIKPLYYHHAPGIFAFASEIPALLECEGVPRAPNDAAIYDYLVLKVADQEHDTFFADIQRVPAAHWLRYEARSGEIRLQRYWDVAPMHQLEDPARDPARAARELEELLRDAVRLRLRSDVRVGTCLSGGLDSSSIVTLANALLRDQSDSARSLGDQQRTFTACFDDERFDERRFSNAVVTHTGASNYRVFPSGAALWRDLPHLLRHMGEPFSSTSQYSQYNVMKLVREHDVTVTLDGQGADELFAGYPGYHGAYLAQLLHARAFGAALREARAMRQLGGRGRSALELAARVGYASLPSAVAAPVQRYLAPVLRRWSPEGRSFSVVDSAFAERYAHRRAELIERRSAAMHDLGKRLYQDMFRTSLPSLLRYEDRNSMAFSIEARVPFLDYRVIELVHAFPANFVLRDGWTKWILRKAVEPLLPDDVTWRKDKKGFVTPEAIWLAEGKDHVRDVVNDRLRATGYLNAQQLRQRVDEYIAGTDSGSYYTDVFRWLLVELWLREYFG